MVILQHIYSIVHRKQVGRVGLSLLFGLLLSSVFLASCSGLSVGGGGSSTPTAHPTPSNVTLSKLHWCNKPFIVFRDEHAPVTGTPTGSGSTPTATATTGATPGVTATGTAGNTPTPTVTTTPPPSGPTTVTDWSQVQPNLGFTVYLPTTLPKTACLVSAYGTLHDPIFGGNFIIGYQLADGTPISLSEAPVRSNSNDGAFQCTASKTVSKTPSGTPTVTASPTQVPMLLCTGARDTTNVVFSAQGSEESLKQFFDALQPDVNWVPAS